VVCRPARYAGPLNPISHAGVCAGANGMGMGFWPGSTAVSLVLSSARRDLQASGEVRPDRDDVVDVASSRGCVWKHEETGPAPGTKDSRWVGTRPGTGFRAGGGKGVGQEDAAPQIVSTMRRVTVYGSQFELGLRSSM